MDHVWQERMRDAADPQNIDPSWLGAIAGYYGGPRAYNTWTPADWARFRSHRKLPIWVAGLGGRTEGQEAVRALRALGVPAGVWTAVDMEMRVDKTYLEHFGDELRRHDYRVWVYGSASTVFHNPALDGYWVADYAGKGPFMYDAGTHREVRATQYQLGSYYDSSTVKPWTYDHTQWWV